MELLKKEVNKKYFYLIFSIKILIFFNKDLELKFDKPVVIKYFYIRPHLKTKEEENLKQIDFEIVGYFNETPVYVFKSKIDKSKKWVKKLFIFYIQVKIHPQQRTITCIKFPKNFEIDDIFISQDTEEGEGTDGQFSSILQNVIDDIIDKTNKNNNIVLDDDE